MPENFFEIRDQVFAIAVLQGMDPFSRQTPKVPEVADLPQWKISALAGKILALLRRTRGSGDGEEGILFPTSFWV
jgi:hypothetical protein